MTISSNLQRLDTMLNYSVVGKLDAVYNYQR